MRFSKLDIFMRLLTRLGDVHECHQTPMLAVHRLAMLRSRLLAHAPVVGMVLQRFIVSAASLKTMVSS